MSPAVCAVSLCALVLLLLPPGGCGITSPCFADGANDWASAMGGHVSGTGVSFEHRQILPWAVKGEGMSVN
jgi:hypothetical protein